VIHSHAESIADRLHMNAADQPPVFALQQSAQIGRRPRYRDRRPRKNSDQFVGGQHEERRI
jgi:hypothetical protein